MKMPRINRATDALIVSDVQNDFCPPQVIPPALRSDFGDDPKTVGGALAVSEGDLVVPIINTLMPEFDIVIATQDWHPPDHISFASRHPGAQPFTKIKVKGKEIDLWPDHCIAGTFGADFHPSLRTERFTHIIRKAYFSDKEAFSGFRGTGLRGLLVSLGIRRVFGAGLTTDYCVPSTLLDALIDCFFEAVCILPACRGVAPETTEAAIKKMKREDIFIVETL